MPYFLQLWAENMRNFGKLFIENSQFVVKSSKKFHYGPISQNSLSRFFLQKVGMCYFKWNSRFKKALCIIKDKYIDELSHTNFRTPSIFLECMKSDIGIGEKWCHTNTKIQDMRKVVVKCVFVLRGANSHQYQYHFSYILEKLMGYESLYENIHLKYCCKFVFGIMKILSVFFLNFS